MKKDLQKAMNLLLCLLMAVTMAAQYPAGLVRLAQSGDSAAMLELGLAYFSGTKGFHIDKEKAVSLFKQSTEKGNATAQYYLAKSFMQADYMLNPAEAVKWLKVSAGNGNLDAINDLGCIYRAGGILSQNTREALEFFEKGVGMGDRRSELLLGEMLINGEGKEKSYARALQLFTESAGQGNALAMHHIGQMYKQALGVKKNDKEAVKWFIKSATAGNDEGMYALGYAYYKGIGIEQDYRKAVYWLEKSARFLNYNGAFLLGYCYQNGYGVALDTVLARKWLMRANVSKNHQAKAALEELEKQKRGKKLKSAIESDTLERYVPKIFSRTKSASLQLNIDGYWEGKAFVYDWSGTRVIDQYPVKVATRNNEGKITCAWIISDSIQVMGMGIMNNNTVEFNGMNFARSEWYSRNPVKWEIAHGQFEFKGTEKNILAGSLSLYSKQLEEEGNPTYVVLKRADQPVNNNTVIAGNMSQGAMVYPNPFTNWMNINYQVTAPGKVRIDLLDIAGNTVSVISEKYLEPGVYTETYTCACGNGSKIYILRIMQNSKATTLKVVKR